MTEPQQDRPGVAGSDSTRRAYISPPVPGAGDRVTDMLFQFETRGFSPIRRRATAFWRRSRRSIIGVGAVSIVFVSGAAVAYEPQLENARLTLQGQLAALRGSLTARQGELELARLELRRLNSIVEHSRRHGISTELATSIYDIATSEGIDPGLAFSLVRAESDFTSRAVSSAGAVGLTQVMPSTAFWLQPGLTREDLFVPETNLRLGFRYLRLMLQQYDGDLRLALLAYNRGPGTVDEILGDGGDPANGYAGNVSRGVLID